MSHADTVSFLGFIVAPGRVQMDPAKVSAVAEWPTPDSRKKVQQFLGFANFYRRFVRGFSAIAAPLHVLTSGYPRFLFAGLLRQTEHSRNSNTASPRLPSSPCLILDDSSWWRLTRPMMGLELSYPNDLRRTAKCTPVHSYRDGCPGQSGIMMSATGSCLR